MSIATELTRIQQAKADIKTAIEAKGVTVPSSATIDTYDDYVSQISGGGGIPMPSKLSSASLNDYGIITSAEIKSGETSVSDYAFQYCRRLTTVTIPNSVTSIGGSAFSSCDSLTSITIPNGVTSIGGYAFENCTNLPSITIPSGVTSIGDNAFSDCNSLSSIIIPNGVTSIGNSTFQNCTSLTGIVIPNGVTSIGNYAFNYCTSLTSCTIGGGVTSIGENAFESCTSLSSITMPDSVAYLSASCFNNCGLIDVTIGSGITEIGEYCFYYNYSLTGITVNATTPPTLGSGAFDDTNNCPIYVPAASVSSYQSAWSDYSSRIQAIPSPTPTGNTWVQYSSGSTIPTGVTFGGVRISSATTIETGDMSFNGIYNEEDTYLEFGADYVCTESDCDNYCCLDGECIEEDEETGECIEYVCHEYSDECCGTEECVSWADGYTYSYAATGEVIEQDAFTYTNGYWTFLNDITVDENANIAPFDIELLVTQ